MLVVEDLHVSYGEIRALRGASLRVEQGEIVCLLGANGAGKSTLMWTLAGVVRPRAGRILLLGRPLPGRPHEVLGRGVCLVPERRRLYANLTVSENLLMGAFLRRDRPGISQDMEAMFDLFPVLRERRRQYAGTLSGGEQQMLAIARGLMSRPRLLLLDEPSLGLAPIMMDTLFAAIARVRERGTTVLLAEQNALRALEVADRGYVLDAGVTTISGSARDLLEDPRVREAYLGVRRPS